MPRKNLLSLHAKEILTETTPYKRRFKQAIDETTKQRA